MSPTAGDGSSKPPQTLTSRILGAFTGPPSSGGSEAKADPPEVLSPDERKAAMTTLDRTETKWALGALILAAVAGIGIPAYYIVANPLTKEDGKYVAVSPDAGLVGGVILLFTVHRVLGPLEAEAHALGVRSLHYRTCLHRLSPAGRIRLHRSRRLADAARLASQQVRHHRFQGHPTSGGNAAPRTTAQGSRPVHVQNGVQYPGARKPPTASKRYTPKAPPRKKIPKATE